MSLIYIAKYPISHGFGIAIRDTKSEILPYALIEKAEVAKVECEAPKSSAEAIELWQKVISLGLNIRISHNVKTNR